MNLASVLEIYAGGPGSGCTGPNCGRPTGSGAKESKAQAIDRIMKERGLNPSSDLSRSVAERVYHEEKFGSLKVLQKLAKSQETNWHSTSPMKTESGDSVRFVKDLGRGKGILEILVSETHPWQPELGGTRPTVDVAVRHKMNVASQTSTMPEHRTFVWEPRWSQTKSYLTKQYGITDFSDLDKIGVK